MNDGITKDPENPKFISLCLAQEVRSSREHERNTGESTPEFFSHNALELVAVSQCIWQIGGYDDVNGASTPSRTLISP